MGFVSSRIIKNVRLNNNAVCQLEAGEQQEVSMFPEAASLKGQVVVITGGSRGIGRAAALRLAQSGAQVMISARDPVELQETVNLVQAQNGTAAYTPGDVARWQDMQHLAASTHESFGPIDVLVVNAGVLAPVGDLWESEPEDWGANIIVNLVGAYHPVRAILPGMVRRRKGRIIFVSSGVASRPQPGWTAYCAAKAGMEHLARTLAAEIDQQGLPIKVLTFHPGVVDTEMQADIRAFDASTFAAVGKYRRYAQEGLLRPPDEPAALIWWLATSLADEYHGQVISLDDATIRQRISQDLDLPMFGGR